MTATSGRLDAAEKRALIRGSAYRVLGTPMVAVLGLVNTAIIVRETGEAVFGLVSLVATVTLLLPFADLGIGATVISASAALCGPQRDPDAAEVVRRAYRVLTVAALGIVLVALVIMLFDSWAGLIGMSSGPADRWAVTVAACIFALTLPAGLGVRILIGIDRNPLATVILMSCPAFSLLLTAVIYLTGADGIWYAVSALGGLLCGHILGTVVALRISGMGRSAFVGSVAKTTAAGAKLLEGTLWLFLVGVGTPLGLQTGRILLAHLSTPAELSEYALTAQIYGLCWAVLSTAGFAYWPVFVRRREATDETVRMWWQLTSRFAGVAAIAALGMVLVSPPAAAVFAGGSVGVPVALATAFGVLLVAQGTLFPTVVLLTMPREARWLSLWTILMAMISIGVGWATAAEFGAVGVVYGSVLGVLVAQVVPSLLWVPRLVRRRIPSM